MNYTPAVGDTVSITKKPTPFTGIVADVGTVHGGVYIGPDYFSPDAYDFELVKPASRVAEVGDEVATTGPAEPPVGSVAVKTLPYDGMSRPRKKVRLRTRDGWECITGDDSTARWVDFTDIGYTIVFVPSE